MRRNPGLAKAITTVVGVNKAIVRVSGQYGRMLDRATALIVANRPVKTIFEAKATGWLVRPLRLLASR